MPSFASRLPRFLRRLAPLFAGALVAASAVAAPSQEAMLAILQASATPAQLEANLAKATDFQPTHRFEARVLFALFRDGGWRYFDAQRADYDKFLPEWNGADALAFQTPEHLRSTAELFTAEKALDEGDAKQFETSIKEAFWLDPVNSRDRASELIQLKRDLDFVVPLDTAFVTLDGKKVTVREALGDKKALYIRYWATWCGPCIQLFPNLVARSKSLPPQGVAVISVNTELGRGENGSFGGLPARARQLQNQHHIEGTPWLMEPDENPLARKLRITSVPRSLVIATDGRVLFNGHPLDPRLVAVLARLDVTLDPAAGLSAPGAGLGPRPSPL